MDKHFRNNGCIKHEAQGFVQYRLDKSIDTEESSFLKTVKVVPHCDVPIDINIVNSHVLQETKKNDDRSHKLKAVIPVHGNEDDLKDILLSDCNT